MSVTRNLLLNQYFRRQNLVYESEDPHIEVWHPGENILVRSLRNLLPFATHLRCADLDHFVDHTFFQVSQNSLEQLFYWLLAGTTNSHGEPLEHIIVTVNENYLWQRYIPENSKRI